MPYGQWVVSSNNPNDTIGGGGCIMDETKHPDCEGPYIVVNGNEMDSSISPFIVICANHVREFMDGIDGEALSAGEPGFAGLNDLASNSVPTDSDYFDNSATVVPSGLMNSDPADDDEDDFKI